MIETEIGETDLHNSKYEEVVRKEEIKVFAIRYVDEPLVEQS